MAVVRSVTNEIDFSASQEQRLIDMIMRDFKENIYTGKLNREMTESVVAKLNASSLFNTTFRASCVEELDLVFSGTRMKITIVRV